jgi:hypothetical protein
MARNSEGWPDFAMFRWGESGFLDASTQYFLVFDRGGYLTSGVMPPDALVEKSEHMQCDGSVRRLSGEFYSVTVWCALGD